MSRHRGLSLIDVLLAGGIFILLVGILLPALTRHRYTGSERSHSANNLRQIALSVHNYNDCYQGKLPPLVDVGTNAPTNAGLQSLFFNILPYIEQDNIYKLFNRATPATYYNATGAAQNIIKVYLSPRDITARNGTRTSVAVSLPDVPSLPFTQGFIGAYATTSYAANGLIPWNAGGLPRTFVDGTANTIMFTERPQVCTDASGQAVCNLWGFGFYGPSTPAFALLTPDTPIGLPSTGQIAPALPLPAEFTSGPIPVRVGRANADPMPSPSGSPFQVIQKGKPCDPRLPGTSQLGGMPLVGLADGSVRTVNPNISPWTFWAACTPDGNETLRIDWN